MAGEEDLFAGKFRIEELLGEGGMGKVHAAVHVISGARVAIKRIAGEGAHQQAFLARLVRESRALALLDQPSIVRLLDVGRLPDGGVYIVMERVVGDSLRTLLRAAKRQGKLMDLELVLPLIARVAEALEYAHAKGVYHRDIKPENLMITEGGAVKVVDFGLAKMPSVGEAPVVALPGEGTCRTPGPTNPSAVLGTPRYMSPEQVRGWAIGAWTDIYALAVVLYECISGHTPYDVNEDASTSETELMGHHCFADPTPIREHVPTCPERLWQILLRGLAKDPADRYSSIGLFAVDLRAALAEVVAPAPAVVAVGAAAARATDEEPLPRPTAPMPEVLPAGPVLPFVAPARPDDGAAEPCEVRETLPTPPPTAPVEALPFIAPPESPRFGIGYTQRIKSAAVLLAEQGSSLEEAQAAARAPDPPPPALGARDEAHADAAQPADPIDFDTAQTRRIASAATLLAAQGITLEDARAAALAGPPPRGVGGTQPMASAATLLAAQGLSLEEVRAAELARNDPQSSGVRPTARAESLLEQQGGSSAVADAPAQDGIHFGGPAKTPAPPRESGSGGPVRSGPGFAFEPTLRDLTQQMIPTPIPEQSVPGPAARTRPRLSLYLVVPAGLLVAATALVTLMKRHDPQTTVTKAPSASCAASGAVSAAVAQLEPSRQGSLAPVAVAPVSSAAPAVTVKPSADKPPVPARRAGRPRDAQLPRIIDDDTPPRGAFIIRKKQPKPEAIY